MVIVIATRSTLNALVPVVATCTMVELFDRPITFATTRSEDMNSAVEFTSQRAGKAKQIIDTGAPDEARANG
jgi:hypothetical protein